MSQELNFTLMIQLRGFGIGILRKIQNLRNPFRCIYFRVINLVIPEPLAFHFAIFCKELALFMCHTKKYYQQTRIYHKGIAAVSTSLI